MAADVGIDDHVQDGRAVLGRREQRTPGNRVVGSGEDDALRGPHGVQPRQVTQLRLGERGMAVGRAGPGEEGGQRNPVLITQVAEVDDGHRHVHVANVTR